MIESNPYFSFRLEEQCVDALVEMLQHLNRVEDRPAAWKWVIVTAHNALHGAFCMVLRRSDGAQLLTIKQETATYRRWNEERETGVIQGPTDYARVDDFLSLYGKVQIAERMSYLGGKPLTPTEQEEESVQHLNRIRGTLVHFSDTSFNVDLREVIITLQDVVDVWSFLVFEAQPMVLSRPQPNAEAQHVISQIRERLGYLERTMSSEED